MRTATLAASAALLASAIYWRRQQLALERGQDLEQLELEDTDQAPTWSDNVLASVATTINSITGTPASEMRTSEAGLEHLKRREKLSLTRYELGDGGWTIGYGHFTPYSDAPPPERITKGEAEVIFANDVADRAERWVKAYVTAPLEQHQFDALVSMAFNMSPRSFRNIAAAVNRGEDPEAQALRYVRAGTNLERGLRNRRATELAMYRQGDYA